MIRIARSVLVVLLPIVAVACAEERGPRPVDVVVITSGEGASWSPLPWVTDETTTRGIESRLRLELGYGGEPIPGQHVTTLTDATVLVTGGRAARFTIDGVDLRTDDPDPERAAVVRADFEAQSPVGVEGTLTRGAAGARPTAELAVPRGAAGAVRHYLQNLQLGIDLLLVPWPEGEVRPGARWSCARDVEVAGLALALNAAYTLEEVRPDGSATVGVDGTLVGSSAELAFAGLPPDAGCVLRTLTATVRGTLTVAPAAPLPTAGTLTLDLKLAADVTHDSETAPLDGRLTLRLTLE